VRVAGPETGAVQGNRRVAVTTRSTPIVDAKRAAGQGAAMSAPPQVSLRALRWLALALVLGLLGLAWWGGVFALMAEPRTFARVVVDLGAWGYLGFLVAYTLLQPFGVPGTVFVVAAPLLWPWPTAFALSMVGTMAASVVGFSFARFVARDWVEARIPARFRQYDEALARHALRTVFVLRLIFWMPQALHGFLGVSRVSFRDHFWGSLLGYIPPLLMVSYFAGEVFDASGALQPRAFSLLGALLAGSLVLAWWLRRDALRSR
jgi:uncharacterized membrane protein YdjX (TVP38/TMEM64 family)